LAWGRVIDIIASTLYVTIAERSNPKGLSFSTPSQGATPIYPFMGKAKSYAEPR